MFKNSQLRELIIKPALLDLVAYSDLDLELLVFTCAVESNGGSYLKQLNGPALGIYQMEPDTYTDLWQNYIKNKNDLLSKLFLNFETNYCPIEDKLIYDLRYATAMARILYMRRNDYFPKNPTVDDIWNIYKKCYNTENGSAEKSSSILKYLRFINNN